MSDSETKKQYIDDYLVVKIIGNGSVNEILEAYGNRPLSYFLGNAEDY